MNKPIICRVDWEATRMGAIVTCFAFVTPTKAKSVELLIKEGATEEEIKEAKETLTKKLEEELNKTL